MKSPLRVLLVMMLAVTACQNNKRADEYVVNRQTMSGVCKIQKVTERPQFGPRLFGPFATAAKAKEAMCANIDETMTDSKKCFGTLPDDACGRASNITTVNNTYIVSFSPEFRAQLHNYIKTGSALTWAQSQKNDSLALTNLLGQKLRQVDPQYKLEGSTEICFVIEIKGTTPENLYELLRGDGVTKVIQNFELKVNLPPLVKTNRTAQVLPWGVAFVSISSKPNGTYKNAWVMDTGVDKTHPDLNINLALSKSFVSGEDVSDVLKHGTHVAGIIGAKANTTGTVGVAPNAPICAVKVINKNDRINFAEYLLALGYVNQSAKSGEVLNLSMMSSRIENAEEIRLLTSIAAKGVFVVLAATNTNNTGGVVDIDKAPKVYPASINGKNIYTVSALDRNKKYFSAANYGKSVDYAEPGVDIESTIPGGGTGTMSGTSMAAPHLSGLLLLKNGVFRTNGTVTGDPDGTPDPIGVE